MGVGSKVNTYSPSNVNLTNMMTVLDHQRKGHFQLSLTNMDTDERPEIAEGSIIEVAGGLFEFDADEEITGSPADGVVYVVLVPDEDDISAILTATAPVWDENKHGWYLTGTNRRAVARMIKSGTSFSPKNLLNDRLLEPLLYRLDYMTQISSLSNGSEYETIDWVDPHFPGAIMAVLDLEIYGYQDFYISTFSITGNTLSIKIKQNTSTSPSVQIVLGITLVLE